MVNKPFSWSCSTFVKQLMLIKLHCASPNICHSTIRSFKKFFDSFSFPIQRHKYWSHYLLLLDNNVPDKCQNVKCDKSLSTFRYVSYFITVCICFSRNQDFMVTSAIGLTRKGLSMGSGHFLTINELPTHHVWKPDFGWPMAWAYETPNAFIWGQFMMHCNLFRMV